MDETTSAVRLVTHWRDAREAEQWVQLYEDEQALVESVGAYVESGLHSDAAAIVIATRAHLEQLQQRWADDAFDAQAHEKSGRLALLDAEQTLESLRSDGTLLRERFFGSICTAVVRAAERQPRVLVFSEMGALLWQQARFEAAVELEVLWLDLVKRQRFTLYTAYALDHAPAPDARASAGSVRQALIVPPSGYETLSLKIMRHLQVKDFALQHELDDCRESESDSARLAAIVEFSDDAIVSKTIEGRISSWNGGAQRMFGYSADEAIGQPITLIVPPDLWAEERQILEKLKRGERIAHFETTRVARDGRRIPVSLTVSPLRNAYGEIVGASKIARDISEWKRIEQALRDADRRKDEFLATLAHELRNPLAPIRYAVAATKKPGLSPEKQRHAQDIIERQLEHMSRLLDDLLDISRITHDSLVLKKRRIELASVIGAAIETARPVIDAKRHTLLLDLPRHTVQLDADPVRLAQIFSNLLVNAAKYTNPGGRIRLRAVQEEKQICVRVSDNGIGISAQMMPRLFTLFAQERPALENSEGGLGIGLALVRGLVALHGGSIEAHSEGIDKGSEFIVRLPIAPAVTPLLPAPSGTKHPARALRVLVADDNQDAAETCATLLELSGHDVRTAFSGRQALEIAAHFHPHAMLLDIGMPELNGYELAQIIREQPWAENAVLIAVTGWGQEEDRQRALAAGFDHHLTKPFDPDTLDALLRSVEHDEAD